MGGRSEGKGRRGEERGGRGERGGEERVRGEGGPHQSTQHSLVSVFQARQCWSFSLDTDKEKLDSLSLQPAGRGWAPQEEAN